MPRVPAHIVPVVVCTGMVVLAGCDETITGGIATKREVSDEQICVLVARDRAGQTLDFAMGNGVLAKARLIAALKPKLAADAPSGLRCQP